MKQEGTGEVVRLIPPHERRILEAHVRGVVLSALAFQEKPLNEYEERELKRLVSMRMKGLPLQYLTGNQDFYGRTFYVNTGVLIPRPETEGLVELVLSKLPERQSGHRLRALDFGTGSGCIALTLALERPDLQLVATDASNDALVVADENASRLRVGNVDFLHVSEEPTLWQYDDMPLFDLIVSNPPYLLESEEIAEDVREHEPPEALFAPSDNPLFYYEFLAKLIEEKLSPIGFAAFEIAENRGPECAEFFSGKGFSTEILQDLTQRDRYLLVRKS